MATQADYANATDLTLDADDLFNHIGNAVKGVAALFNHKVSESGGSVPNDVLHGILFGLAGQSASRNGWRVYADAGGDLLFQRNTGSEVSPTWNTRFTMLTGLGGSIPYADLNLTNSIVNADVNTAAAIAYSKLALTGSILNADINAAAAIAYSKLNLSASIVDADVNSSAAIQRAKIEGSERNLLINPSFRLWQDGTTRDAATVYPNNDDVYIADQWILLSDGNDVVDCTREASVVPTEETYAIRLDVETANKKFGIFQPIEALETKPLRGKRVSLSFEARITGSSLSVVRYAVVAWTGTADSITSDIVSAWEVAGTNPTLVANWAYVGTPSVTSTLTTSYQSFNIGSLTIPTNATNIGVFIWSDDVTTTAGDFLYLSKVSFSRGATAPAYTGTPIWEDNVRAKRFYEKTFGIDVAPADASGSDDFNGAIRISCATTNVPTYTWMYGTTKRITPTITLYCPRDGGTAGQWTNSSAELANARSIQGTTEAVGIDNTSTVASSNAQWYIHAKADARL